MTGDEGLPEFHSRRGNDGEEYSYAHGVVAPPSERRQKAENKERYQFHDLIGMECQCGELGFERQRKWYEFRNQSAGEQQEPEPANKHAEHRNGYDRCRRPM